MTRRWRMGVSDLVLESSRVVLAGPAHRFVYVLSGLARVRSEEGEEALGAGAGALARGGLEVDGSAVLWIFEVDGIGSPPGTDKGLAPVLSVPFDLSDEPRIVRADRVETPPGIVSPRHGHRGPGIRRLLQGRIQAEIGEEHRRIEAGQAWFETGEDPVIGANTSGGVNAFVRVMILPAALAGGVSSFVPMTPERADRPRTVTSTVMGEMPIG